MNNDSNVHYFERRKEEADQLAAAAADQHVRNIHIAMAVRYTLLAEQANDAHDPQLLK